MTKKLIAFDIDGTILDNQKQPLQSTLDALKTLRDAGHIVTIATGRSYFLAKEVIDSLGFDNYILCNGAAGFIDHQQVFKNTLNPLALQTFIEKMDQLRIDIATLDMSAIRRRSSYNLAYMTESMESFGSTLPEIDTDFHNGRDIYQSLAYFDETMDNLFEEEFDAFRFIRWHPYSVDVVPKNGSKAATILHLADHLGISHEDTIAFGDGLNDFEMIQTVGTGVAMGNAVDSVKNVADMITDSNEEDGIFNALKQLKLI